jgi:succinate dehydrogenase / fumarate reductase iron-sulfur subunit
VFRIVRQDSADRPETRREVEFEPELAERSTLMAALFQIAMVSEDPVAFDAACHGDACGACTLLVNGRVRPACRTNVSDVAVKGRVFLEPLGRFELIRDLSVVRTPIRDSLQALGNGLPLADGKRVSKRNARTLASIDRCSECGACLEACPEWSSDGFAGALALNELRVLDLLPSAAAAAPQRLDALMSDRGIAGCGKSENCVEVCPERIPLVDSILALQRSLTRHLFRRR